MSIDADGRIEVPCGCKYPCHQIVRISLADRKKILETDVDVVSSACVHDDKKIIDTSLLREHDGYFFLIAEEDAIKEKEEEVV